MVDRRRARWKTRVVPRWLAVVAVLAGVMLPVSSRAAGARIETASGPVRGVRSGDVYAFRGLPYAAPPVGPLRWRTPQPVASWIFERDASSAGAACPQKRGLSLEGGGDPGPTDEDCLYLNVMTPASASQVPSSSASSSSAASSSPAPAPSAPSSDQSTAPAGRPVMVWIHGGALLFGSGALRVYDGSALARRGVVVVTINYRLGPLGFFAHPALARADGEAPMNFGLLDQIAALRWVHDNIASFGGDPSNVTIVGQSAGAESVLALMASPLATGLFARAIAQSPYGVPSATRAKALQVGAAIATAVGLPGERATATALRRVPAERLTTLDGAGLSLAPTFVVGDAAVPRPLLQAFREGREAPVPLIVGSNSDDASVALAFGIQPAAVVARLGRAKGLLARLYPEVDDDGELGRQATRDTVFTAFVRRIAYLHAPRAPTYRYYFSHGAGPGAGHGAEVPYMLGTTDTCGCLALPVSDGDRGRAARRRSLGRVRLDRHADRCGCMARR